MFSGRDKGWVRRKKILKWITDSQVDHQYFSVQVL